MEFCHGQHPLCAKPTWRSQLALSQSACSATCRRSCPAMSSVTAASKSAHSTGRSVMHLLAGDNPVAKLERPQLLRKTAIHLSSTALCVHLQVWQSTQLQTMDPPCAAGRHLQVRQPKSLQNMQTIDPPCAAGRLFWLRREPKM